MKAVPHNLQKLTVELLQHSVEFIENILGIPLNEAGNFEIIEVAYLSNHIKYYTKFLIYAKVYFIDTVVLHSVPYKKALFELNEPDVFNSVLSFSDITAIGLDLFNKNLIKNVVLLYDLDKTLLEYKTWQMGQSKKHINIHSLNKVLTFT